MNIQAFEWLHRLQAVQFALVELQLYLDTHPTDNKAKEQYTKFSDYLKNYIPLYEKQFGPLFQYGLSNDYKNNSPWVQQPWPWELEYPKK